MIRSRKRLQLCTCLLCVNLIFIWGNSLLPGHISGALSDWLKDLLAPLLGQGPQGGGGGLLRKIAHFTEFACLGMCLRWLTGMLQKKQLRQLLFPLIIAIGVACIDETIQIFVPNRGPGIKDVLLDSAGALVGIAILTISHILQKKRQHS